MDRGRLPVAKRTRLQTQKFYREISGGKTSKKSKVVIEREGNDDDVVFLGILGSGGGDKCLTNAGEVGTPEESGGGSEAAGVDGSGSVQREMNCVDEVEKELDIIDVEKELTCLEVEVGEKVGKKKKKNGGDEALKKCSAGKRITGFQEIINGQVSAQNGSAEDGKETSGSEKPDGSSEEESLLSSSSEENDDLEDEDYDPERSSSDFVELEDYDPERSSSDFVELEDGDAAIDEFSSEDGDSFGVEDLHEMAKGSHPSSEMKRNTKNKEENKSWGVVTTPSSMWIEEEEDEEEIVCLVRRSRVAQRTRSHDIALRQGIVEEKASLGTFDNPYCLVEDGAENVVTSEKTNSAHERIHLSGTAGSKTAASESMSVDNENLDALYRQGLFEYFSNLKFHEGITLLRKVKQAGDIGASYILGVIYLFSDDDWRKKGVEMVKKVHKEGKIDECRKRFQRATTGMSTNKRFILEEASSYECSLRCEHYGLWRIDVLVRDDVHCEACLCKAEMMFLYRHCSGRLRI